MQDPIRYYITKRGEEPTVRSVKVAQSAPEGEDRVAPSADAADRVEGAGTTRSRAGQSRGAAGEGCDSRAIVTALAESAYGRVCIWSNGMR